MKIHRLVLGLLVFTLIPASANPTGGVVTSGAATINPVVGKTLTIDQTTQNAIINWNTFNINYGETTRFVQPNATSAALNRVTGGGTSIIDGTLTANGQVYLINGNGIYVGGTGKVSTSGFIASTQDIADSDFLAGNLHFTGTSDASVQNFGAIQALGGNIYLIGRQVSNGGTLYAPNGAVGLAAAQDVVVAQKNSDGSTVTVSPTSVAASVSGTGVSNTGVISSAVSELRAANGNIYALAINNSGTIRATGVAKKNGKIWLVADSGTVQTSGALETTPVGKIETSGDHVGASGIVSAGAGGTWTIDPSDVTISTAVASATVINNKTLSASLTAGGNVNITTTGGSTDSGTIDVLAPVTWTSTAGLTLTAMDNININSNLVGTKGALTISAMHDVFAPAAVDVANFTLATGFWNQIIGPGLAKLPVFIASTNFTIDNGATFARFAGGDGAGNPYQIVDIYGLQGIESGLVDSFGDTPTANLQNDNFILEASLNAASTKTWNSGAGFVPILNYAGTFNGNTGIISGLTINLPGSTAAGLFGSTSSTAVIENLTLASASVTGTEDAALLVGDNAGTIQNCIVTGNLISLTPGFTEDNSSLGGLAGVNSGVISDCISTASLSLAVNTDMANTQGIGGLVGLNEGQIVSSTAVGKITVTGINPFGLNKVQYIGGLVGWNQGSILSSTSKTPMTFSIPNVQDIGGLVGYQSGTGSITSSTNSGALVFSGNVTSAGGLVGDDVSSGNITDSSNSGAILVLGAAGATVSNVGGLIGEFDGTGSLTSGSNIGAVTIEGSSILDLDFGGLVGLSTSTGTISLSHNSGALTISAGGNYAGGLVGNMDGASIVSSQNTGAIKLTNTNGFSEVGGLVGTMGGTSGISLSSSTSAIANTGTAEGYGGLIGYDLSTGLVTNCNSAGSITLFDTRNTGGLVGVVLADGTLQNSSSSNAITITFNSSVAGIDSVGGVAGQSEETITACTNSGNIVIKDTSASTSFIAQSIGGVVGDHSGFLTSSSNSGIISVGGSNAVNIGGVVGLSHANGPGTPLILSCSNSGAVSVLGSGAKQIGGVIGYATTGGIVDVRGISNSGTVTVGNDAFDIGGGIGLNATGNVFGVSNTGAVRAGITAHGVGGDIGNIDGGEAEMLSNTGTIAVGAGSTGVGGSIGTSNVIVGLLYSTGTVSGNGSDFGGLVGLLGSTGGVDNAYSTGAVTLSGTNNDSVGGLVGQDLAANNNAVNTTYSTGRVTAKGTNIGGLVGFSLDAPFAVESSYWDVQSSGQATSAGGTAVATTLLMETQGTYAPYNGVTITGFDFTNTWGINPGGTPFLLAFNTAGLTGLGSDE